MDVYKRFHCAKNATVRCADEIAQRFHAAVVEITVTPRFNLIPASGSLTTGPDPPPVFTEFEQMRRIPMTFNGFFIDKGYIVGSSAWLEYLYLAVQAYRKALSCLEDPGPEVETVLGYLANLSNEQIWQIFNPTGCVGGIPVNSDIASLFEITAQVKDVNGCPGKNYFYNITPIGIATIGVAVYEISRRNGADAPNRCVPCLETVPSLKFAQSCSYKRGNPAHVLGSWKGVSATSISSGVVTNNSVIDKKGLIGYEGIATSIPGALGMAGAPILNQCAQVIGMVTGLSEHGTVFGITSDFMLPIVCALINAFEKKGTNNACAQYSSVFGMYIYEHGDLSVKGEYVTAGPLALRATGGVEGESGILECPPLDCHSLRRPSGFLLTEICGCARAATHTIECPPSINVLSATPAQPCRKQIVSLSPGDVILSINNIEVGIFPHQYSIDQILNTYQCGEKVNVRFARLADGYRKEYDICITLDSSLAWHSNLTSFYVSRPENALIDGEVPEMFPNMGAYFFNVVPDVEKSKHVTELALKSLAITNSFIPPIPPLAGPPYTFLPGQMNPLYYEYLLALARCRSGFQYRGAVYYDFVLNGIQVPETLCSSINDVLPVVEAFECTLHNGPSREP